MAEQSDPSTDVTAQVLNRTSIKVSSAAQNVDVTIDIDRYEGEKSVHVTADWLMARAQKQTPYETQLQGSEIRIFQVDETIVCEDHIRVVFCRHKIVDLVTDPDFKAISYTSTWAYLRENWYRGDGLERVDRLVNLVEPDDPDITTNVFICNGQPIFVHQQCYSAVDAFSSTVTNDWVWIDALCIRQNDGKEKASQVLLMRRIFASASEVLVFLGPPRDLVFGTLDEVMEVIRDFVKALLEAIVENRIDRFAIHHGSPRESAFQREVGITDLDRKLIAFGEFCGVCRWFGRVWCIQEGVLSCRTRLRMGNHEFDWETLSNLVVIMTHQRWDSWVDIKIGQLASFDLHWFEGLVRMVYLQRTTTSLFAQRVATDPGQKPQDHDTQSHFEIAFRFLSGGAGPAHIELGPASESRYAKPTTTSSLDLITAASVLAYASSATCYDDRDRVYGVLGLLDTYLSGDISSYMDVDYSKSVEDVMVVAVSLFLEQSQSLDVLGANFPKLESKATQSSWMPYLRAYNGGGRLVPQLLTDQTNNPFNASEGLLSLQYPDVKIGAPFEIKYPQLKVFGGNFDVVKYIVHADMSTIASKTLVELAKVLPERLRGRRRFDCIWRTLIRDLYDSMYPAPEYAEFAFHQVLVREHMAFLYKNRSGFTDVSAEQLANFDQWLSNFELDDSTSAARQSQLVSKLYEEIRKITAPDSVTVVLDSVLGASENFQEQYTRGMNSYRKLFVTEGGLLGSCPPATTPNDEIWILSGSSVPFALHPGREKEEYSFIGHAFMVDLMNGEMLEDQYKLKDRLRYICLV